MSKKNRGTAIAPQTGGELAAPTAPSPYARDYRMEGKDQDDVLMPRVILHQGDISEKYYGSHEKGTLLHSVTTEPIESRRFVPTGIAWKEWIKFGQKFGDPMEYRTRKKSEVPADDLVWHDKEPPACSLFFNFVVAFEGLDSPVCLSIKASNKKTKATALALNQMEELRAARKAGPGLYEIEVDDDENASGKWKYLRIRPVGNPSEAMAKLSFDFWRALSGKSVEVHVDAEPAAVGAYDPDKDG